MSKGKCTFCPTEIESPRGHKALMLGWHVMEFTIDTKDGMLKCCIIACPEHSSKLMPEFDRIMKMHIKKKE